MPTEEFFFKTVKLTNTTSDRLKQEVERGVGTIFCSSFKEEVPKFDKAPCETILPGAHNSFIILGRDRNKCFLEFWKRRKGHGTMRHD
jgi:hypothetical protein